MMLNNGDIIEIDGKLYVVVEVYENKMRILGLDGKIQTVDKNICEKVNDA